MLARKGCRAVRGIASSREEESPLRPWDDPRHSISQSGQLGRLDRSRASQLGHYSERLCGPRRMGSRSDSPPRRNPPLRHYRKLLRTCRRPSYARRDARFVSARALRGCKSDPRSLAAVSPSCAERARPCLGRRGCREGVHGRRHAPPLRGRRAPSKGRSGSASADGSRSGATCRLRAKNDRRLRYRLSLEPGPLSPLGFAQRPESAMTQPTLGLLEKLRPPLGFRTQSALAATYSADLLTCMAILTTLDGGDGDHVRYGRVEVRALDRLRDKVRICTTLAASAVDGTSIHHSRYSISARAVRLPGWDRSIRRRLGRQVDEVRRERFVLIISSQHHHVDGLGSRHAKKDTRMVAEWRCRACAPSGTRWFRGEPDGSRPSACWTVRWTLPPHVRDLAFDFQAGSDGPSNSSGMGCIHGSAFTCCSCRHSSTGGWSTRPRRDGAVFESRARRVTGAHNRWTGA